MRRLIISIGDTIAALARQYRSLLEEDPGWVEQERWSARDRKKEAAKREAAERRQLKRGQCARNQTMAVHYSKSKLLGRVQNSE